MVINKSKAFTFALMMVFLIGGTFGMMMAMLYGIGGTLKSVECVGRV